RPFSATRLVNFGRLPNASFAVSDYFLNSTQYLGTLPDQGQLRPILTPLSLAGLSPVVVEEFMPYLHRMGMTPVLGGGAASTDVWQDAPLQPGSTVAVQLVRGDMDVSASGTLTYISGDKLYAFGHPFMSVGNTSLPLSQAAVVGVIPSLMSSQKLSATTQSVGVIQQDRSTGIMGVKGGKAGLIPVNLTLKTSRNEERQFRYEVVADSFLTPFLVTFTVHSSITASERTLGGQTLLMKCRITVKGQPEVNFENAISDIASSPAIAAINAAAPVHFLLNSGFENVELEEIDVRIDAAEEMREAALDKVWQDKLEVRPGEEVGVTVFLRKENGEVESERYPVKIPEGIPPGDLKIMIGDGLSLIQADAQQESAEFIPQNLRQLVRAINNIKKNDRLYVRLFREQQGAVIGGEGLPGLPPSIMALYSSQKTTGDTLPINRVVFVEHELPATDYVLTGQKVIQVKVKG
ncbi:MAG: hypothetical protein JSU96_07315, partial [Acidobacteriota bacterium]